MPQLLPFRPASGTYFREDFVSNDAVTTGLVGENDWDFTAIGGGATEAFLITTNTVSGRPGILRDTTAAGAGPDGTAYHMDIDAIVLDSKPGSFSTGVCIPAAAGNTLANNYARIGLDDSVTSTAPTVGIWICITAGRVYLETASADHGDYTGTVAGVDSLTTGHTMVLGTWYDMRVEWWGENANGGPAQAQIFINEQPGLAIPVQCAIDNDEEMEIKIAHYCDAADTMEMDFDYYDLLIKGRG